MMAAEAHVEGPQVEPRLALDDPSPPSPRRRRPTRDARGEAAGDVDAVAFRRETHDRLAVGRDRDRAVDHGADAELVQDRQALGGRQHELLQPLPGRQQLAAEREGHAVGAESGAQPPMASAPGSG